jgi:uncharacterized membrane protein YhaH (DUF805 family)
MDYFINPLKKYADFNGRASRKEYWMFFLLVMIVAFILGIIEVILGIEPESDGGILITIFQIFIFLPSVSVAVRRMHDVNERGWLILIPLINLILFCSAGTKGVNKFGPEPFNFASQTKGVVGTIPLQKNQSVQDLSEKSTCSNCKNIIESNTKFCKNCGARL